MNIFATLFTGLAAAITAVFGVSAPVGPPVVMTQPAQVVASSSALLIANVNPHGAATTAWFRYGTTSPITCNDSFGTRLPFSGGINIPIGTSSVYSLRAMHLTASSTYYFCGLANNKYGIGLGNVLSFLTKSH